MSFVATARPPVAATEPPVTNAPWFPDLNPATVRDACRLDGTITPARLLPALKAAMLSVNAELEQYRLEQQSRWGYTSLAEVPAPMVGGESAQVLRYQRAVHACLQADLAEVYRNLDTLPAGAGKEGRVLEALAVQVDEHRQKQRWAISDLLGLRRSTVELI